MIDIINTELVVFNYNKLEDGDVFTYTPPYCFGYKTVYTVFKTGMYMHVTVTKIYKDQCEVGSYLVKENQKYYLDRYGNPIRYCNSSIQEYLIKKGELPPDTIKLVTLNQLKEELHKENVAPLISRLGGIVKEYTKLEQVSTLLKGELNNDLQKGDELLLKYNGGYGNYSYAILVTKEEEEEEGIFEYM